MCIRDSAEHRCEIFIRYALECRPNVWVSDLLTAQQAPDLRQGSTNWLFAISIFKSNEKQGSFCQDNPALFDGILQRGRDERLFDRFAARLSVLFKIFEHKLAPHSLAVKGFLNHNVGILRQACVDTDKRIRQGIHIREPTMGQSACYQLRELWAIDSKCEGL